MKTDRYNTLEKRERHADQQALWKQRHPEAYKAAGKKWRETANYKSSHRTRTYKWMRTTLGKKAKARTRAKRKGLPILFTLNNYFLGSHLHHLLPNVGVYIPESLHRSVRHDIWSGNGMVELNDRISSWMESGAR